MMFLFYGDVYIIFSDSFMAVMRVLNKRQKIKAKVKRSNSVTFLQEHLKKKMRTCNTPIPHRPRIARITTN